MVGTKGLNNRQVSLADVHCGKRIREVRKAKKLTARTIADRLRVTHQQLAKYETGANRMSVGRLFEIAAALGVPVTELVEGFNNNEGEK